MVSKKLYKCDICVKEVPEDSLEHMRIFHSDNYNFKKMEFIENAVIIGLDSFAAEKTVMKMSGENLEKEISNSDLMKKIPNSYSKIKGPKEQFKAKKWYLQKLLIDARAKSIIHIVFKKLRKQGMPIQTKKKALALVDRYSNQRFRSCYDERIIALTAILVACKLTETDLEIKKVTDLIFARNIDPEETRRILGWMKAHSMSPIDYVKKLMGKQ
ncbi:MAG: hypothetical protein HeimC3_01410 [Candidatus Heimdallarchaeota archaeon LC_3]|nr:MAG: hypothetical protein HeimC3_01410 [Candidatus Heimdallarchaeota archaeon LC_3]